MDAWKVKVWENDTALEYLTNVPARDLWSMDLNIWIPHSFAEASILFAALTDKVPECCEALLMVDQTEEWLKRAVRSVKSTYTDKHRLFALARLRNKINDLLFLYDDYQYLMGDSAYYWEDAVEVLAQEIEDSGILDPGSIRFPSSTRNVC